jgi:hypothetical protein
MIFLVVLVGRVVAQGYSTFETHTLTVPVYLNPERIDASALEGVNYDYIVAEAMMKKLGVQDDDLGTVSSKVMDLTSRDFGNQLLQMVKKDQSLIGKTVEVTGSVKADADLYYKGEIKRSTAEGDRKLDNQQLDWLDRCGPTAPSRPASTPSFFTNSDSTEPEQAGVWGAVVGSTMMLVITALIAIPVGVMAAVYLEEFAPEEPLDRRHRGQHQQPGRRAVDRLRPAGPGAVHQLAARAARLAAGRRPGAGPDGPADRDHRHPQLAEGRAAVDPRSRPRASAPPRPRPSSTTCCRWPCPG